MKIDLNDEMSQKRLDILSKFGLLPSVSKEDDRTVFNYWQAMYWGKPKQPFTTPWALDGEESIPNEINAFQMRKILVETGTGRDPYEAFDHALSKLHLRREKRSADFLQLLSGTLTKNGAVYYYLLHVDVFKIKT